MPVGMITDVSALALGGLIGAVLGRVIGEELKKKLNDTFGFCAVAIGVRLIVRMENLSAVVLAVVLGAMLGHALHLEDRIDRGVRALAPRLTGHGDGLGPERTEVFCAVAVLFCCSGTGWYGVLNEGFTGDGSILVTKAILDFFTAIIFAAVLGKIVACLAIPQLVIFLALFSVARLVVPYVTDGMIGDFSAVGGVIEIATGMRIAGIKKDTKILDMVPAMILVFLISALWAALASI